VSRTIVLLDVTAMSGDAVCVAGIDLSTGETLRLNDPQPTRGMLRRFGGLVPGDVIRVDWQRARKVTLPHVEDGDWKPHALKKLQPLAFADVVQLVSRQAFDSIEGAFGKYFYKGKENHAWKPGEGSRSLATLRVQYVRADSPDDRLRMALRDLRDAYWRGIPFQDLIVRSHATQCRACEGTYLQRVRTEFHGNKVLVRVGLTRPFAPDKDHPEGCWLQVTNVLPRAREHFT